MGEKKEIKVNLYVAVAIVLVIIFLIMGYYIFSINKSKKTLQIEKEQMQDKVSNLENQVSEYQNKIDTVMNVISDGNNTSNTNAIKSNTSKETTKVETKQNTNLQDYVGEWYESNKHALDLNPNNLTVKGVNGNQIIFDLYITRTLQLDDVKVSIDNNFGKFEAIADREFSKNEQEAKVCGYIKLNDNSIKLVIENSNVQLLDSGKEINFTYVKRIDDIAKDLFERASNKIRETFYSDYPDYQRPKPITYKEINGIKYEKTNAQYADVKIEYAEIFAEDALTKVLNKRFANIDGYLYVLPGGATGWDITNVKVSKLSDSNSEIKYKVEYNDVLIDDSISEHEFCNMTIKYIDGSYKIVSTDYCDL